jgi:hypothetical protein
MRYVHMGSVAPLPQGRLMVAYQGSQLAEVRRTAPNRPHYTISYFRASLPMQLDPSVILG